MKKVLAVNSGSLSYKFKLFSLLDEKVIAKEMAIGLDSMALPFVLPWQMAVSILIDDLKKYHAVESLDQIVGVGHRVVNGGEYFKDSTVIDQEKLQKIRDLSDFAPLHNPAEARGIEAFMNVLPDVPQVAVFDTSFHETLDPVHYLYSIPYEYYEKYRARKYGAHGTSVHYVTLKTAKMLHKDPSELKMIICHLGSGSSITAVKNGKSFDTSMGFSPLSGITMGTRSGDIDPSLLQHLMHKTGMSIDEMINVLNKKSGLLGISGISSDMRDLKYNKAPRAVLARQIFLNRIVRYIGSFIAEMGGTDVIVLTAGVGEADVGMRKAIMDAFKFMGVVPDHEANEHNGQHAITKPGSTIKFLVVPTNEELMIAREVVRLTKCSTLANKNQNINKISAFC